MKTITELAREAGLVLTCDVQDAYIRDGRYGKQLERFAALVRAAALEEAADICERLGLSQNSEWEAGTLDCAAAIRQLKETK